MTIRTNIKAGGIGINHNEALQGGFTVRTTVRARGLTRGALAVTAGFVTTVLLAAPAHAERNAVLHYTCNLNGAPGQLTMQVQAVTSGGAVTDPSGYITGVIPTGVIYFLQGTLTSATGLYSFHGENQFADFLDHLTNDRFRVQMIARGQQLLMIINPHGPGPTQHLCQQ